MALVLALLEIQIEGPHGWAKNLPTWRPAQQTLIARTYAKLMNGKEFTGYHLLIFAFVFLMFHFPFLLGAPWGIVPWVKTLSFFFLFVVLWDFLWFVCNPHYPLKQFRKEHIWWHARWRWLLPVDYYIGVALSFVIILLPDLVLGIEPTLIRWWLGNVALFILQTTVVVVVTLKLLRIDHWSARKNSSAS